MVLDGKKRWTRRGLHRCDRSKKNELMIICDGGKTLWKYENKILKKKLKNTIKI